jgi:protein SCO1
MSNMAKFLVLFFILLIAGFLGYFVYQQNKHLHNLPVLGEGGHTVGTFSFTNQDGKTITEKDVQSKMYVVEYFFTTCKGICPKMNENMAKVYQVFKEDKDFMILSHTVDPETDTVAQLKRYSQKFEANPNQWHFLTGTKQALYTKAINDYLVTAADSTEVKVMPSFIHTERFVLVDKYGRLRGKFYDGTNEGDVQQLIGDIKELKDEEKDAIISQNAMKK